jgi:hypothetical protein
VKGGLEIESLGFVWGLGFGDWNFADGMERKQTQDPI